MGHNMKFRTAKKYDVDLNEINKDLEALVQFMEKNKDFQMPHAELREVEWEGTPQLYVSYTTPKGRYEEDKRQILDGWDLINPRWGGTFPSLDYSEAKPGTYKFWIKGGKKRAIYLSNWDLIKLSLAGNMMAIFI